MARRMAAYILHVTDIGLLYPSIGRDRQTLKKISLCNARRYAEHYGAKKVPPLKSMLSVQIRGLTHDNLSVLLD